MKSDAVVHLAQWQYWWWFWFSFLWGFYYLTANRVVRHRVLKFRPRMYTSYRSHGKWGDFLACAVPALWCFNILTNSSFILRVMEWQNEASLFNIRVRGRQWYWIYKFELRHLIDLASVPKNIGHDRWVVNMGGVHDVLDSYLLALKVRSQNPWLRRYWTDYIRTLTRLQNHSPFTLDFSNFRPIFSDLSPLEESFLNDDDHINYVNSLSIKSNLSIIYPFELAEHLKTLPSTSFFDFHYSWKSRLMKIFSSKIKVFFSKTSPAFSYVGADALQVTSESVVTSLFYKKINEFIDHKGKIVKLFDSSRALKKVSSEIKPVVLNITKINPVDLITNRDFISEVNYFTVEFNKAYTVRKPAQAQNGFFVIKQKRYRLKQFVPYRFNYIKSPEGFKTTALKFRDIPYFQSESFINQFEFEATRAYRLLKKERGEAEMFSSQLSRRLLRTRKTLVLPASVNLTLITNSYDVVHSWFLPSLGLKMDCIPGRSTHHSFFVDNLGFFYGQCAEVCGRYHHHMPIRLCMLPYEHFFVWWQHFGVPKILGTFNKNRYETSYIDKIFEW